MDLLKTHKYSKQFQVLLELRTLAKKMFQIANPVKYAMYNGNCCRQMAFICSHFLNKMVPSYEWRAYEARFKWVGPNSVYEHAWCYGTCKGKPGILVDLAFDNDIMKNYLVEGENSIPCGKEGHVELAGTRVELTKEYFNHNEYYTGLPGQDLVDILEKGHKYNGRSFPITD